MINVEKSDWREISDTHSTTQNANKEEMIMRIEWKKKENCCCYFLKI
jgi:hypothetical protein